MREQYKSSKIKNRKKLQKRKKKKKKKKIDGGFP